MERIALTQKLASWIEKRRRARKEGNYTKGVQRRHERAILKQEDNEKKNSKSGHVGHIHNGREMSW